MLPLLNVLHILKHNLEKVCLPFRSHCSHASLILLLSNSLQDNKFSPLLLVLFYFASLFLHYTTFLAIKFHQTLNLLIVS